MTRQERQGQAQREEREQFLQQLMQSWLQRTQELGQLEQPALQLQSAQQVQQAQQVLEALAQNLEAKLQLLRQDPQDLMALMQVLQAQLALQEFMHQQLLLKLQLFRDLEEMLQQAMRNVQLQQQQQQQQQQPVVQAQPIKLTLRGVDEPSNNQNDDVCFLCHVNKAVVASLCCGKRTTCISCTRTLYEGKNVGQVACLNCRQDVSHAGRIF